MINRQQSLPLESVITINLSGNNSFLVPDDTLASTTSIVVKFTDPVSTIFDNITLELPSLLNGMFQILLCDPTEPILLVGPSGMKSF